MIGSVLFRNRSGYSVDTDKPEWPGQPAGCHCSCQEGRWLRLDGTSEGVLCWASGEGWLASGAFGVPSVF